jgi:hypothetical protein
MDDERNLKPKMCDGCATGSVEFIDITYAKADVIKSWSADPCSKVRMLGKINPDRLHYCVTVYNDKLRDR